MTLAQFLADTDQNATAFAAKIECEVSTITRILRGERKPSLELALRIERATDGKVSPADLAPAPEQQGAA